MPKLGHCNLCGNIKYSILRVANDSRQKPCKAKIVKCSSCHLIYVYSDLSSPVSYDSNYHVFLEEDDTCKKNLADKILYQIDRYKGHGKLLEIGPGRGIFLKEAKSQGWDVLGLEVSGFAASKIKEEFQIEVRVGTLSEQDFPEDSFDVIVMHEVIEHLQDPLGTLKEIYKFIKNDGVLSITTPNARTLNFWLGGSSVRYVLPEEHHYYFTPSTLQMLLEKAGFSILSMETYDHNLAGLFEDILAKIGICIHLQRFFHKPDKSKSRNLYSFLAHCVFRGIANPIYKLICKLWKVIVIPLTGTGQTIHAYAYSNQSNTNALSKLSFLRIVSRNL